MNEELTDITRVERFKKWAKENLLGLAGVAIMAGSLIMGIIIAARGAIKTGAKAVGKFGKAVDEIGKFRSSIKFNWKDHFIGS